MKKSYVAPDIEPTDYMAVWESVYDKLSKSEAPPFWVKDQDGIVALRHFVAEYIAPIVVRMYNMAVNNQHFDGAFDLEWCPAAVETLNALHKLDAVPTTTDGLRRLAANIATRIMEN